MAAGRTIIYCLLICNVVTGTWHHTFCVLQVGASADEPVQPGTSGEMRPIAEPEELPLAIELMGFTSSESSSDADDTGSGSDGGSRGSSGSGADAGTRASSK